MLLISARTHLPCTHTVKRTYNDTQSFSANVSSPGDYRNFEKMRKIQLPDSPLLSGNRFNPLLPFYCSDNARRGLFGICTISHPRYFAERLGSMSRSISLIVFVMLLFVCFSFVVIFLFSFSFSFVWALCLISLTYGM